MLSELFLILALWAIAPCEALLPRQAPRETPWDDLRARLSDPTLLKGLSAQQFNDNCIQPFVVDPSVADGTAPTVSNYMLVDHPACLDFAFCGYENCAFDEDFPIFPAETSPYVLFANHTIAQDRLALPAMTLEPRIASDIVHAVEFCSKHKIGVTVKVSKASLGPAPNLTGLHPCIPSGSRTLLLWSLLRKRHSPDQDEYGVPEICRQRLHL